MHRLLLFTLLATVPVIAIAQDHTATIQKEAMRCMKALSTGDFETVAALSHLRVVNLMGGKEAMVATLTRGAESMQAKGVSIEDVKVGEPEVPRKLAGWLVSVISQHITLKTPDGPVDHDSFLVGISEDEGKTWVFADVTSREKFNSAFPEIASDIKLPEKEAPAPKKE